MLLLSLFLGSIGGANAVPVKLNQQGRLLDNTGSAITGIHLLHVRIFDDQSSGNMIWDESQQVLFNDGYYAVILGSDIASNPLEDTVLTQGPLFVEVEVNNSGPMGVRQELVSAPYARLAGQAQNLSGGSVDASSISIDGQQIIDNKYSFSWINSIFMYFDN